VKPRICVPLPATELPELDPMISRAEKVGADLLEIRLDYLNMRAPDAMEKLERTVGRASVPVIATNRQYKQGGYRLQNEEERVQTLIRAATVGFQYVDLELTTVELKSVVKKVRDPGATPIVSFHDLEGTPEESEMEKITESQIEAGAEICKLVTTANELSDSIRCLDFTRRISETSRIVCFAMGRKGVLSRALSPFFGGRFTFASLERGLETASGQISIAELKELYGKLGVDG